MESKQSEFKITAQGLVFSQLTYIWRPDHSESPVSDSVPKFNYTLNPPDIF